MSGYNDEKQFVVAEARRQWSRAERERIVAETESASVSSVARKHGVATSLLFRWRRDAGCSGKGKKPKAAAAFVPVSSPPASLRAVASPLTPSSSCLPEGGGRSMIEIILSCGHRLRVDGSVDGAALKRVIAALEAR
jgi:transposase